MNCDMIFHGIYNGRDKNCYNSNKNVQITIEIDHYLFLVNLYPLASRVLRVGILCVIIIFNENITGNINMHVFLRVLRLGCCLCFFVFEILLFPILNHNLEMELIFRNRMPLRHS